jgi:NAD(P)-dependent dehydrogenase (short-subunit alcohol dehydrogenase family)
LQRCGATLILTSQHAGRLAALANRLDAYALPADLAQPCDCRRVIDTTLARFGRIDALITCADVWMQGDSDAATEADWDRCIDINLKGVFFLCAAAIPALKKSRGAIINVGSDAGMVGNAGCAIYCASKGGVTMMSNALAIELAPFGVRVNTLCPPNIGSPMQPQQAPHFGSGDPGGYHNSLLSHYPQGHRAHFTEPDEVACVVVFLLMRAAMPNAGVVPGIEFGLTAGY